MVWIFWQILISYSKFLMTRPLKWGIIGACTIIWSRDIHKIATTLELYFPTCKFLNPASIIKSQVYLPKCVPIPNTSIECPWSLRLSMVSSLMSLEATIMRLANHSTLNCLLTLSKASLLIFDKRWINMRTFFCFSF